MKCAGRNGRGLVVVTSTGSCFGCQKLIKKLIRPKFDMWYPSTWVSIINHIGCGLAVATPTGIILQLKDQRTN